jgi:hypothetical protein
MGVVKIETRKNMRTVKHIAAAILIAVSVAGQSYAQDAKQDTKMELKEHKCTSACKNGKHVYAHGEKGHVCTKECKKMMKKDKM